MECEELVVLVIEYFEEVFVAVECRWIELHFVECDGCEVHLV